MASGSSAEVPRNGCEVGGRGGVRQVEVRLRPEDRKMKILPWIDPENFNPGYLMRAMHLMPRCGSNPVWQHTQDYWKERVELPAVDLDGKEFKYG